MKLRSWFKKTPTGALLWQFLIGFIGGVIFLLGLFFLIAPGPGILVIFLGLGILATEFAWARRAVLKAKKVAATAKSKTNLPAWAKFLPIILIVALGIVGIWLYLNYK